MAASDSKQALVFGASGIAGWAIARECLVYPSQETFANVLALAKQPLTLEQFLVDGTKASDRLRIHSGIDLLASNIVETFVQIPGIEKTTHVFFAAYAGHNEAYTSANPFEILSKINAALIRNALVAVNQHCPQLESWVLVTGGKAYGFELLGVPGYLESVGYSTPLRESMLPLPSPWGEMIFYNAQHNELLAASKDKPWTFTEVIPDVIVGFAPRTNPMCLAQTVGLFLSFYLDMKGAGAEIAFPGPVAVYDSKHSDTSQDVLARFSIYAALHPDKTAEQRWNISDSAEPTTWRILWPQVCELFELKGLPPAETSTNGVQESQGATWLQAQRSQWAEFEKKHSLKPGIMEETPWLMLQMSTEMAAFDRDMDLSAIRKLGFLEDRPVIEGYKIAFERFKAIKVMP